MAHPLSGSTRHAAERATPYLPRACSQSVLEGPSATIAVMMPTFRRLQIPAFLGRNYDRERRMLL
jgi:hypothetical protein